MELIPIREVARRLGISDTSVRKAIAAGRITQHDEDKDPKNGRPRLRWPDAKREYDANTNSTMRSHVGGNGMSPKRLAYAGEGYQDARPPAGPAQDPQGEQPPLLDGAPEDDPEVSQSITLAEANRLKAIIAARQGLLELQRDRGKLVDRDNVNSTAFKAARQARDAILTMPDRLAPILASQTDIIEVHRTLLTECERICADIARGQQAA